VLVILLKLLVGASTEILRYGNYDTSIRVVLLISYNKSLGGHFWVAACFEKGFPVKLATLNDGSAGATVDEKGNIFAVSNDFYSPARKD
jgi:hypothetical protein